MIDGQTTLDSVTMFTFQYRRRMYGYTLSASCCPRWLIGKSFVRAGEDHLRAPPRPGVGPWGLAEVKMPDMVVKDLILCKGSHRTEKAHGCKETYRVKARSSSPPEWLLKSLPFMFTDACLNPQRKRCIRLVFHIYSILACI